MISLGNIMSGNFRGNGSGAPLPIGFDLAAEKLHMLQAEKKNSDICIRAAVSVPYPVSREDLIASPRALRKFVHAALKSKPFTGRKIVSCLPNNAAQLLNLNYKSVPGADEAELIVKSVMERIGGDVRDYVIDYLLIRSEEEKGDQCTALAAVARRDEVIEYLEMLDGIGLDVAAIDIGPSALRRLVAFLDRDGDYPYLLLINFGRIKSYLTVTTGRRLMMDREVDFGEHQLVSELSRALEINEGQAVKFLYNYGFDWDMASPKEGQGCEEIKEIIATIGEILKPVFLQFVEEVNKALIYTASRTRGGSIKKIYLVGSVARYPAADKFLAEMLSIPVEVLNPFAEFAARSDCAVPADLDPVVGIVLAAGFALRGVYDYT